MFHGLSELAALSPAWSGFPAKCMCDPGFLHLYLVVRLMTWHDAFRWAFLVCSAIF